MQTYAVPSNVVFKQDRQCTYNVISRRVYEVIVIVEKL